MKIIENLKYHRNANIQAKLLNRFLSNKAIKVEFEANEEDLSPVDLLF